MKEVSMKKQLEDWVNSAASTVLELTGEYPKRLIAPDTLFEKEDLLKVFDFELGLIVQVVSQEFTRVESVAKANGWTKLDEKPKIDKLANPEEIYWCDSCKKQTPGYFVRCGPNASDDKWKCDVCNKLT